MLRRVQQHPATARLCGALPAALPECGAKALANVAWAYTVCRIGPDNTADLLLTTLAEGRMHLNDVAIATAFRACAAAPTPPRRDLLSRAVDRVTRGGFAGWDLGAVCTLAWSLVQLGAHSRGAFRAIADTAARRAHELTPRELASLAWALVKVERARSEPAAALLQHTARCIDPTAFGDHTAEAADAARPRGAWRPGAGASMAQELSAKEHSQLLWAFSTEAKARLRPVDAERGLARLSKRARGAALANVWPEVPANAVIAHLMRTSMAAIPTHDVRFGAAS